MRNFTKDQLAHVEVLLGEPNEQIRESMRSTMRDYGLRRVRAFSRLEDMITALNETPPDLLIFSDDLGDGTFDAVRNIRHFKIGRNPFVMISLLVQAQNEAAAKQAVLSGADDIMVKPIAPGKLMDRVSHFTLNRLPFIVTTDYLGPERRRPVDARPSQIKRLNVVNSLKAKIDGSPMSSSELNQAVKDSMQDVMAARLDSHGLKLGWVCAHIMKAYTEKRIDHELKERLLILVEVLEDASRSAMDIGEKDLAQICTNMARQVEELAEDYENPSSIQLGTIQKLTKAFELAKAARAG